MKQNISQMELAEKAELSVPYISYIETGKKQISLSAIINIAAALSVTPNHLLTDYVSHSDITISTEFDQLLKDCNNKERDFFRDLVMFLKGNRFFND